jgi:outer membrane biosynthesis protein TonB
MIRAALFAVVVGTTTFAIADRMPDPQPAAPAPLPEALDRASISTGMATAKPKVMACGDAEKGTGKVKVEVVVGPDGRVTKATTDRPAGDKLGACVAAAVKSVTFSRTQKGGSFSYPFVFSSPVAEPAKQPDPTAPADTFDRVAISTGIAAVKTKIALCGDKTKASGKVKMRVVVGADGRVTSATVEATPDPKLGECVAAVLKSATFKKTPSGGSFSYPFVFGSPAPTPPAGPTPAVPPANASADTGLDRAMISDGISKVKSKISACGTGASASVHGTVKIKVTVTPAGTVTTAEVQSAPGVPLGACVAGVLKGASFAKTAQGGSFSYPFVF